jgi:radical SAM superfamily enzyme YgiQ (UPF0313 family)
MRRLAILALHIEESPEALALGATSVAAAVARAHAGAMEAIVVEGVVSEGTESLSKRVLASRPDWLGLSLFTWNCRATLEAAAACARAMPGLVVFAGGPEATADPGGVYALAERLGLGLDFVVRGEGEGVTAAALSLLASRPRPDALAALAGLRGVVLPGGPFDGPRAPLEDLERLPSPWTGGFIAPKDGGVLWELSRGCPFRCSYCFEGRGERGLRSYPMSRLEAELDRMVALGAEQAFVLDPTFDADKERARAVLDLIARKPSGIHWKFEVRAELLDRDLVRRFSKLDCSLQIGLQSASDEVCEAVHRPLDRKAFARGIALLNEAGIVFGIDLIYGLPRDDLAGFSRSLDFALGLQPNHLDVFPLSVLPGTVLAEEAEGYGLVYDTEPPHALVSSPGFPREAFARAARLARACDLFYSRGRAVSWFLQALRPLGARPSAFLGRFGAFLEEAAAEPGTAAPGAAAGNGQRSQRDIEGLQLAFLEAEYRAKGLGNLLPALCDIVSFNGAWGRALAEGEASGLRLSYDPDEVLGPEALDLASFARTARRRPASWIVRPGRGGPVLERDRGASGARGRRQGGRD